MTHSNLLLNDGTSLLLLNTGSPDNLLLNAVGPPDAQGVTLVGDHSKIFDFRDFRAPAKQFNTCIIGIACKIRIFITPLVEASIIRSDSMPLHSTIQRESTFNSKSKIYHNSLHESKGKITYDGKLYEVHGMNDSQYKSKRYLDILNGIEKSKITKEKIDEIKKMYKEYKDERMG